MAETARNANGKFVKRNSTESNDHGGIDSANTNGDEFGDGSITVVDPTILDSGTGSAGDSGGEPSGGKRGRGRPRGSNAGAKASSPKNAQVGLDKNAISALLYSIHTMLAIGLKAPVLAISEDESKRLADAAMKVAVHYDIQASAKTLAWGNLAITVGAVYGTKLFALAAMKKQSKPPVATDGPMYQE